MLSNSNEPIKRPPRSKVEMRIDILRIARKEINMGNLIDESHIPWVRLQKILPKLIENDLLTRRFGFKGGRGRVPHLFTTTEKGIQLYEDYDRIKVLVDRIKALVM